MRKSQQQDPSLQLNEQKIKDLILKNTKQKIQHAIKPTSETAVLQILLQEIQEAFQAQENPNLLSPRERLKSDDPSQQKPSIELLINIINDEQFITKSLKLIRSTNHHRPDFMLYRNALKLREERNKKQEQELKDRIYAIKMKHLIMKEIGASAYQHLASMQADLEQAQTPHEAISAFKANKNDLKDKSSNKAENFLYRNLKIALPLLVPELDAEILKNYLSQNRIRYDSTIRMSDADMLNRFTLALMENIILKQKKFQRDPAVSQQKTTQMLEFVELMDIISHQAKSDIIAIDRQLSEQQIAKEARSGDLIATLAQIGIKTKQQDDDAISIASEDLYDSPHDSGFASITSSEAEEYNHEKELDNRAQYFTKYPSPELLYVEPNSPFSSPQSYNFNLPQIPISTPDKYTPHKHKTATQTASQKLANGSQKLLNIRAKTMMQADLLESDTQSALNLLRLNLRYNMQRLAQDGKLLSQVAKWKITEHNEIIQKVIRNELAKNRTILMNIPDECDKIVWEELFLACQKRGAIELGLKFDWSSATTHTNKLMHTLDLSFYMHNPLAIGVSDPSALYETTIATQPHYFRYSSGYKTLTAIPIDEHIARLQYFFGIVTLMQQEQNLHPSKYQPAQTEATFKHIVALCKYSTDMTLALQKIFNYHANKQSVARIDKEYLRTTRFADEVVQNQEYLDKVSSVATMTNNIIDSLNTMSIFAGRQVNKIPKIPKIKYLAISDYLEPKAQKKPSIAVQQKIQDWLQPKAQERTINESSVHIADLDTQTEDKNKIMEPLLTLRNDHEYLEILPSSPENSETELMQSHHTKIKHHQDSTSQAAARSPREDVTSYARDTARDNYTTEPLNAEYLSLRPTPKHDRHQLNQSAPKTAILPTASDHQRSASWPVYSEAESRQKEFISHLAHNIRPITTTMRPTDSHTRMPELSTLNHITLQREYIGNAPSKIRYDIGPAASILLQPNGKQKHGGKLHVARSSRAIIFMPSNSD